ncbi:MAG: Ppx/GppA phosphatase family protein [Thermodesulfovibrionales bacterium]|nr:Ppx/GppA phosphatase family protein [Thermodesulfovibrionales bacterium]
MPPLASIDIGSNTLRLLVGMIEGQKIVRMRCEMVITRLAAGIGETGLLNADNMGKSVSVLKVFSDIISAYGISHIRAVGTSALREAENSEEFIRRVLSKTGIKIEVISGEEEAELTARGVIFDLPETNSSLIVDIGGGSAEWIFCRNSSPVEMGTIPTGVVKLFDKHIKSDPPSKADILSMRREAGIILNRLKTQIGHLIDKDTVLIGTAGTITTLASIDIGLESYGHEKIHRHNISLEKLYDISGRLISIPLSERKKMIGLEPERADLIIPGILFTINIMELFGFDNILVSDNGLLEGVLIKLSERVS